MREGGGTASLLFYDLLFNTYRGHPARAWVPEIGVSAMHCFAGKMPTVRLFRALLQNLVIAVSLHGNGMSFFVASSRRSTAGFRDID